MSRIATADTTNVAASNANATPVPTAATSVPPSAGPARRRAIGRTNWSSAFAAGS